MNAHAVIADDNEKTTKSSSLDFTRRVWLAERRRPFRTYFTGYESNDELALNYRLAVGGGFGRYFIDTNNTSLSGALGQVLSEESTEGQTTGSVEGVVTTTLERWRYDSPKFDVRTGLTLFPGVTEKGRLRGNFDIRLRGSCLAISSGTSPRSRNTTTRRPTRVHSSTGVSPPG